MQGFVCGGFFIPRLSQYRVAVLPIVDHGIMLSSFYRNYSQRKKNSEIDSAMWVPGSIHNEAISVQVPCVKDWKVMVGRESVSFNIDEALFKRSLKSVFVAMSDFQIVGPRWQRSRFEKMTFAQNEIRHALIIELVWILDLPAHKVSLFCEMIAQLILYL